MSQEQPRRPREEQQQQQQRQPGVEPIKYGDVFSVSGDLASKPIAPQDAAMLQSAEAAVLGQPQRGGPADTMRAAAAWNERAGLVSRGDVTDVAGKEGLTVERTITERVAGQRRVTGSNVVIPGGLADSAQTAAAYNKGTRRDEAKIRISEVLTGATLKLPADRAANRHDAEWVMDAELRTGGKKAAHPGGVAASVAAAVRLNEGVASP
ncbi:hypothetical protein EUGRSUZ_B01084 [Eucalyptus grandis]|uniref:Uncharacterized protein n=1 Tax=Eucalyptus grandis TaxID=71139 RepID=A0ACC3LPE7_EUCGR|nr:hypothetical protein EUGRSUZ_B01084 [Eucalyptus grandis]